MGLRDGEPPVSAACPCCPSNWRRAMVPRPTPHCSRNQPRVTWRGSALRYRWSWQFMTKFLRRRGGLWCSEGFASLLRDRLVEVQQDSRDGRPGGELGRRGILGQLGLVMGIVGDQRPWI